jgi:hypothetical protein
MSGAVLEDVASRCSFIWLLSLPTWGRCGRTSLPLHRPTTCSHQTMGRVPEAVLSHRCSGRWRLSGGCEAPGLGYLVES